MPANKSAVVRRKDQVREYLKNRDFDSIVKSSQNSGSIQRTLASLLFETDPLVQWRAIEATGLAAAEIIKYDREAVRRHIRRLFWLMNDESGGLCWNAPEAIAEIIVKSPDLADEYVPILFTFMDEEPFEAGVRWSVRRLAENYPDKEFIVRTAAVHLDKITNSMDHQDPKIRAYGFLALTALDQNLDSNLIDNLSKDSAEVDFYDMNDGSLQLLRVCDFLNFKTKK